MTPTKDQQAQEYAEKIMQDVYSEEWDSGYVKDLIEQAHIDGYTACEQSMWRSVEEEEPPIGKLILCRNSNEASLAYYDGEDMYEASDNTYKVQMPFWMPIPSISEKR